MIRIAVSADLLVDAQRDLKDIGCADLAARTKNITDLPYGKIRIEEGVIFSTYSALCTKSKTAGTRLDQIINWLGAKATNLRPRPAPLHAHATTALADAHSTPAAFAGR